MHERIWGLVFESSKNDSFWIIDFVPEALVSRKQYPPAGQKAETGNAHRVEGRILKF